MRLLFTSVLVLVLSLPFSILATEKSPKRTQVMYKYTDEQNVTIISNTLPPEIVNKGYSILNSQGREQEKVEPRLSNHSIEETLKQESNTKDNSTLLKMFDNVEEIQQSKKEKITAIENIEQITLENIKHVEERIQYIKKMIVDYQAKKQPIPVELNQRILDHKQIIRDNFAFLNRKKIEKKRIGDQYDTMIKNFQTIKTTYKPPIPEESFK